MYLTIVNEVDFYKLQSALNSLYSWATVWQLPISIDKCYVLNIGVENFCCNLVINNQVLPNVLSVRDLGITITRNVSPVMHVNDINSRAHKRALAIFHRCFVSRDTNTSLHAYIVYVRPLVQHNSVIWSPSTLRDIDAIESVQRLPGLYSVSYTDRLKRLHLQSLELRRLVTDLIWCYKIVFVC